MTVTAGRTTPPTEDEVKDWLVSHYAHKAKMRRDRIDLLIAERGNYAYLNPPAKPKLYRGLQNVTKQTLEKLQRNEDSDATKDKSWTTSKDVAWRFARGEFSKDEPIDGRFAVVLSAPMPSDRSILNAKKASKEPGIGDQWNEIWGETLEKAIASEKEVLVSGSIKTNGVDFEPMQPRTNASMKLPSADYEDDYSMSDGVSPRMENGVLYIPILDVIGERWWGSSVSGKSIRKALDQFADCERIVLEINCPGGDVNEGTAMFGFLRATKKPIEARVYGMAASMASVLMLVADKRVMLKGSRVMIHNPWTIAMGDSRAMHKVAGELEQVEDTMLGFYTAGTGGAEDVLRTAMAEEKWLTAEEAVDWGFAEEVVDGRDLDPVPAALAANAEWQARRGAVLSSYKNAPVEAGYGGRLGWTGPSTDELRAAMTAAQNGRLESFAEALAAVRGAKAQSRDAARSPAATTVVATVPAAAPTPSAPAEPFRLEITVKTDSPPEDKPPPREATTSGTTEPTAGTAGPTNETTDMKLSKEVLAIYELPETATEEEFIKAVKTKAEKDARDAAAFAAERDKARAEAEAAKALADQAERERLAAQAKAIADQAQAVATAQAAAAVEAKVFKRQAFDAQVIELTSRLPPAFAKQMQTLCYRKVDESVHPSGLTPNEDGYAAATAAVAAMPQLTKEHYTAPNTNLAEAQAQAQTSAATPVAHAALLATVAEAFPMIADRGGAEALVKHHEMMRARDQKAPTATNTFALN